MQDIVFYSSEFNLSELAEKQKLLGNTEVVLCRNFSDKELNELKEKLKQSFPVKFFSCYLMLKNDSRELNSFKNKTDFIAVLGGNPCINNFAVSSKKIDFLIRPCAEGRLVFDTALARLSKENNTKIIIPFSQFLGADSHKRISLTKNYAFLLKIAKKFKLNPGIVSFAESINELRSVEELQEFKKFLEKKFEQVTE
ncbi:MAG: RNase P subunit p30 family protein [archaeon]